MIFLHCYEYPLHEVAPRTEEDYPPKGGEQLSKNDEMNRMGDEEKEAPSAGPHGGGGGTSGRAAASSGGPSAT